MDGDLSVVAISAVVLRRALAGADVPDQQDEGEEVGRAQGAGAVAAERTGSWWAPPSVLGAGGRGQSGKLSLEQGPCPQGGHRCSR